ncbi:ABC transporter permease [Ancylobacter sonchi]|uniref:ABC transporter permease n=1 Tax=Ancylobacter sonchi TaxID=1937790 RepID=UPI001BD3C522|nr:ABC transporter permease [Ancylobacter sonchi]MBS7533419.1 ABC transporter permease [Ancylobacter sonchi]
MTPATSLKQNGLVPVLGMSAVIVAVNAWLQPSFFDASSIASNLASLAPLILVSVAQAIVILNRELDLSMGAGVSLLNCLLASFAPYSLGGVPGQLAATLGVALLLGATNGVLVAVLGLPSLIATFATSALWFGGALAIMPQPGGAVGEAIGDAYYATVAGVPVPLLVIAGAMALWMLVSRHRVGRWIVVTGSSPAAVFQAGISLIRVRLGAYLLAWFFVFLSAVAISAQTLSGDARLAQSYTLGSIAACVIGGISLRGGKGSPWGALLGAVVLGVIGNVIYFAGIPSSWQEFTKGLIVVGALGFIVFEQRTAR